MLVPLTREKFEQLIPLIASSSQYKYCCGKFSNLLQRVLISVVGLVVIVLIEVVFRLKFGLIIFVLGVFTGFFWLWYPVFLASIRNAKIRRYKYSGFFRGRILDWWITDSLIGKQETVNPQGELVIIENREKRINLEIGDNTGFSIEFQAPLRPAYKAITTGQVAEMLVMSNRPDLSEIEEFSDIYIPSRNLWVSDYPLVRQDFFNEISLRLRKKPQARSRRRRREED
ncbi:phosphate ABC transporter permease [Cronbergia sp. UHCC 0137]|uniref:phosphate ABC transporter permease n=1 Tax=Cronbergia sp. UHCC 0137 TaxID=3110239 RepID=UPI002B202F3F|nr:phosphate ABC transporter permease [Cronbergia sp. UHCC 0137]MEA5619483.1 phosphate ABC transporter permease [Cronbergia sp. UHCC 0137]